MKDYPLSKYRFYHATRNGQKQVIAVSTYAGKVVRGRATCSPEDNYNEIAGRELAAARCNEEISRRRYLRAIECFTIAREEVEEKIAHYENMGKYVDDAQKALVDARAKVDNLLKKY